MRYLLCTMVAAAVLQTTAFAQDDAFRMGPIRDLCHADLDMDGADDSLWYDIMDSMIVFNLSSRGYEPFGVKHYLADDESAKNYLSAEEGEFSVTMLNMRSWEYYTYRYDASNGLFRLTEYYQANFGNAVNDGSGTMSMDFLENRFTADWNYYDHEKEELVPLPTVELYVNNPVIYFGDDTDFEFPGYDLYDSYREEYGPAYTDTVRFVGFEYDYDYPVMISAGADGDDRYDLVMCNYEELYKGDLINATTSICFYQEPGEGESYRARMAVSDIELVEAGPLRRFMESVRKTIYYYDSQSLNCWGAYYVEDMNYYLAVADDKTVRKYLKKPGILRINFHDCDSEALGLNEYSVCFLIEIYNDRNEEMKLLRKLVLEYGTANIKYWLVDDSTGELTLLDIK